MDYEYIDISADEKAADEVIKINKGMQSITTIICPDGTILMEPSEENLKECILKIKN